MDFTCGDVCHFPPSEAPLPALPKIANPFDPCSYGGCGAGICTRKSNNTVEYQCNCLKGYGNIMNQTWGFCSRSCEFQGECWRLKITDNLCILLVIFYHGDSHS
ncbi:hypothetical protein SUGI_0219040 [Cryptomeria japonica]|nr:hypothetical protein SUGI_0219040 [Cryptomeria japonica]